jgi:DNA (cytosine-5)-methyltransferase 1
MPDRRPTAISLFAGAGGCSLGFELAGYDIRYATDIDRDAVETYRLNFPGTPCEAADIRDIEGEDLLRKTGLAVGSLDILLGGPPCQGFSSAGAKSAADPRNALLAHYVRILGEVKPKWFIMENVEGLLTNAAGQHVAGAVRAFLEIGYSVNLEKIYAQGYGVPQRRKRVLIVGNRLGHQFEFPPHSTFFAGSIFRKGEQTFDSATGDLPAATTRAGESLGYDLPPRTGLQAWLREGCVELTDHYAAPLAGLQAVRAKRLRPGQTMRHLPAHLQHPSFVKRAFRRVMDGTPTERRGGAPSGLKRLIADEPSLTITGAATREFVHPNHDRPLTLRECARLQTFPDRFAFHGNFASRIKQIGNAIPPLLAETMGARIRESYGFQPARPAAPHPRLAFRLTQSEGMSPALARTQRMLSRLGGVEAEQMELPA